MPDNIIPRMAEKRLAWTYLCPVSFVASLAKSCRFDAKPQMKRVLWFAFLLGFIFPAQAQEAAHGVSLYDTPKYGPDFTHYDYVNPDAPKGGELSEFDLGTYDGVNPFILKGLRQQAPRWFSKR